jgi:osmoprotectant transport system permease protein
VGEVVVIHFLHQVVDWFGEGAHWEGTGGIPHRLQEHMSMSAVVVLVALLVALPIGLLTGHTGRGGVVAVNVSNIGRAVPSFAILVFSVQLFHLGSKPTFIALLALGIPPIVTNTYTGMRGVDPEIREAARGMGMTGWELLWHVEVPLALPLIMAGVRTAAVQVVATATLAAIVAWGGLGRYIIDGFGLQDNVQIFAGATLVATVSVLTELGLAGVQRLVVPRGLRRAGAARTEVGAPVPALAS